MRAEIMTRARDEDAGLGGRRGHVRRDAPTCSRPLAGSVVSSASSASSASSSPRPPPSPIPDRWPASRVRSPICRTARYRSVSSAVNFPTTSRISPSSSMSDRRCVPPRPMKRDARSSAASRPVRRSKRWPSSTASVSSRKPFPRRREEASACCSWRPTRRRRARPPRAASAPAAAGQVAIGGQSRIIIQPGEETVEIYYLLDIVNGASGPVNPPARVRLRHAERSDRDRDSGGFVAEREREGPAGDRSGAVSRPAARSFRSGRWFRPGRHRCS